MQGTNAWDYPLQGLIAQQQNPLTNLPTPVPQQAQPGFMDQFAGFAQSPQGQAALMSFANAALQASMNPRTQGGIGFLGAVGQGLGAHKQAGAEEAEKKWKEEQKELQRKQAEYQAAEAAREARRAPLSEEYLGLQIEQAKRPKVDIIDTHSEGRDGRIWIQPKKVITKSDGTQTEEPYGKPYPTSQARQPRATNWTQLEVDMAAVGIDPSKSTLTPEEAQKLNAYQLSKKPETGPMAQTRMTLMQGRELVKQTQDMFNSFPRYNGMIGKGFSNVENWTAWLGNNPDVRAYNDFVEGTVAPLVRSLGEKGNLSDRDIERGLKLIPRYPVTGAEADAKFRNLNAWFDEVERKIQIQGAATGKIEVWQGGKKTTPRYQIINE